MALEGLFLEKKAFSGTKVRIIGVVEDCRWYKYLPDGSQTRSLWYKNIPFRTKNALRHHFFPFSLPQISLSSYLCHRK